MMLVAGLVLVFAAIITVVSLFIVIVNAFRRKRVAPWLIVTGCGVLLFVVGTFLSFLAVKDEAKDIVVNVPPTGSVTSGASTEIVTASVPETGGVFTVSNPGNALNGMEITIPAGSYNEVKTLRVSSAPVTGNTFGKFFNPVSPLITVDELSGYANDLISVKIPVNIPQGHFAMPFIYHDETGTLEGLPVQSVADGFITFTTRHFSHIVISSVSETLLNARISSGFSPGTDDWEFTNFGSFIAPNGHCAGQSLTAMWYYNKKTNGGKHLWGQLDNNGDSPTPDLWQDDSQAYRFASSIQEDVDWGSWGRKYYLKLANSGDELTWKQFAYSLLATGQPQYIEVWDTGSNSGHAMIVYGVDKGTLKVSDPNFPGSKNRQIIFRDGRFSPYNSGANADEIRAGNSIDFNKMIYIAGSAVIDFSKIEKRWSELQIGTVGNDLFPPYRLMVADEAGDRELPKNYSTDKNLFGIFADGSIPLYVSVYRDNAWLVFDSEGRISLREGNNHLGVYVRGKIDGDYTFVDFKWVDVNYKPKVTPTTPTVSPTTTPPTTTKTTATTTATNAVVTIDSITHRLVKSENRMGNMWYWFDVEASGTASVPVNGYFYLYPYSLPGESSGTAVQISGNWKQINGLTWQRTAGTPETVTWKLVSKGIVLTHESSTSTSFDGNENSFEIRLTAYTLNQAVQQQVLARTAKQYTIPRP